MITVGVERWLFRRGEARRAQGSRFAHTRQGLALGGLEAALTVLTFGAGAVRDEAFEGLTFRPRATRPGRSDRVRARERAGPMCVRGFAR